MTEKHLATQHHKATKKQRRFVLIAFLVTIIGSGILGILIPVKPDNIVFHKNSHHHYAYPEDLTVKSLDNHYESEIHDENGELKFKVRSHFLVGDATVEDMLNQFYYQHFEVKNEQTSTYQFQNSLLTFVQKDDVVTVYEYDKSEQDRLLDFINEPYDIVRYAGSQDYLEYTPNQYRDILDYVVYEDSLPINSAQEIFGNEQSDEYVRELAYTRGYKQRVSVEDTGLQEVEGFLVAPSAKPNLEQLLAAARKSGHSVNILSAHRSVPVQRSLFAGRYAGAIDNTQILDGVGDSSFQAVLDTTAPPGMSKHHSSYTVDLAEEGVFFTSFKDTNSFKWLSENDYENAKKYGFVPSYPEGADNQGPNPEAWEYTYVGNTILKP